MLPSGVAGRVRGPADLGEPSIRGILERLTHSLLVVAPYRHDLLEARRGRCVHANRMGELRVGTRPGQAPWVVRIGSSLIARNSQQSVAKTRCRSVSTMLHSPPTRSRWSASDIRSARSVVAAQSRSNAIDHASRSPATSLARSFTRSGYRRSSSGRTGRLDLNSIQPQSLDISRDVGVHDRSRSAWHLRGWCRAGVPPTDRGRPPGFPGETGAPVASLLR